MWIMLTIITALIALYALISNILMRKELDDYHYIFSYLLKDEDMKRIIERYNNKQLGGLT